jgi:hypothetical protein
MSEDIQPLNDGTFRMNTCIHRSELPQKRIVQRCKCQGGPFIAEDYHCNKRQISALTAENCQECPFFEHK